ncbi:hypothetical protein BDZ94DRAFT_246425 [Collybia nuda]|uniref:Uncharacterized protein n=1 Tax=Collybia nuda TaxID=64659 RepID=A0A9P6CH75_9AGAR|nr:hypothetical protein BDZ94DRAFT_246425 [Collybia nuda]
MVTFAVGLCTHISVIYAQGGTDRTDLNSRSSERRFLRSAKKHLRPRHKGHLLTLPRISTKFGCGPMTPRYTPRPPNTIPDINEGSRHRTRK